MGTKPRKAKNTPAKDKQGLDRVTGYRFDKVKRKNNPPAKIAAEGTVPLMAKIPYEYSPRLAPELRFDQSGRPDKLPALLRIDMIEYCVFCHYCSSPILLGTLHGSPASKEVQFILAGIQLTCQSCDRRDAYKGNAAIFSRTGKYAYWGIVCECGEFQPLLKASLDYQEQVPDVQPFKWLCRHRSASPALNPLFEQNLDKTHLKKTEQDEEIQNFHPYPLRRRS